MNRPIFAALLTVIAVGFAPDPVPAQTRLTPKGTAARPDNCAPIGRTAKGELVYSMKCDNVPAPAEPPPQARIEETAPPPPPAPPQQETRGGLFGWSYDRRQDQ